MQLIRRIVAAIMMLLLFSSLAGVALAAPPVQQPNGQVCVQAFDDANGNALRDADEKALAGVGFTLSDDSGVKGSYSTDGVSEPYCFGKLAAGPYTVRAKAPVGYESTAEGQWAISLASGAQYDVKYGAQKIGGDSSAPGNPSAPSATAATGNSSSPSTLGRIVLGGLGVVILLAAGFMAGMFVQRSRAK